MKHHRVNLYQVCSNFIPGAKNGPAPGDQMFYVGLDREKHDKILSEIIWPGALIFSM